MKSLWLLWSLIQKELRTELRQKDVLFALLFFTLAVMLMIYFSFPGHQPPPLAYLSLVLWTPFVLAATLVVGRTFNPERDSRNLDLLALFPGPPSLIYISKVVPNLLLMVGLNAFCLFFVFFLLNVEFSGRFVYLLIPMALADVGLASLGTLISGIFMHYRSRDVLLPILFFPLSMPLLIASVQVSLSIINHEGAGAALSLDNQWLLVFGLIDVIFVVLSYLLFDFLFEEV